MLHAMQRLNIETPVRPFDLPNLDLSTHSIPLACQHCGEFPARSCQLEHSESPVHRSDSRQHVRSIRVVVDSQTSEVIRIAFTFCASTSPERTLGITDGRISQANPDPVLAHRARRDAHSVLAICMSTHSNRRKRSRLPV